MSDSHALVNISEGVAAQARSDQQIAYLKEKLDTEGTQWHVLSAIQHSGSEPTAMVIMRKTDNVEDFAMNLTGLLSSVIEIGTDYGMDQDYLVACIKAGGLGKRQ